MPDKLTNVTLYTGKIIELEIESLNYSAFSVGKYDGFVVFVSGGVPGDRIKAQITNIKKNYAFAESQNVIRKSPYRCDPPCRHFIEGCGGCQWQHIKYEYQLQWKLDIVKQALKRIGRLDDIPEIKIHRINTPFNYRNKLRLFPVQNRSILFGMHKHNSHEVVPIKECLVSSDKINSLRPIFTGKVFTSKSSISEITVRTSETNSGIMLSCLYGDNNNQVDNIENLMQVTGISSIFIRQKHNNKYMLRYGSAVITEEINGIYYDIGPDNFFQINIKGLKKIIDFIIGSIENNDGFILDAHCGVGTFALQTAKYAKQVWGVDISSSSIEMAKLNAKKNDIDNVYFSKGTLSDFKDIYQNRIDIAILDPPREGCRKSDIKALAELKPPKIIYISCNPTTFARDLYELKNAGYKIYNLHVLDMFPMTYHLELLALLKF